MMNASNFYMQHTVFGPIAIVWSVYRGEPKILRILLPKPGMPVEEIRAVSYSGGILKSCPEIERTARDVEAFLSGSDICFSLDIVRLDICSVFQQKVLKAEHAIPRGAVSTYQRIARYLGNPDAARAVGAALSANPFPVLVPCHRAIRTDRTLGGFQGGLAMKRNLLEMEGIGFDARGRVEAETLFY